MNIDLPSPNETPFFQVFSDASMTRDGNGACAYRVVVGSDVIFENAFFKTATSSVELEIIAASAGLHKTPIGATVIVNCDVENMVVMIDRPHRVSYSGKFLHSLSVFRKCVRERSVGFRCHKSGHHNWCHDAARALLNLEPADKSSILNA